MPRRTRRRRTRKDDDEKKGRGFVSAAQRKAVMAIIRSGGKRGRHVFRRFLDSLKRWNIRRRLRKVLVRVTSVGGGSLNRGRRVPYPEKRRHLRGKR